MLRIAPICFLGLLLAGCSTVGAEGRDCLVSLNLDGIERCAYSVVNNRFMGVVNSLNDRTTVSCR